MATGVTPSGCTAKWSPDSGSAGDGESEARSGKFSHLLALYEKATGRPFSRAAGTRASGGPAMPVLSTSDKQVKE